MCLLCLTTGVVRMYWISSCIITFGTERPVRRYGAEFSLEGQLNFGNVSARWSKQAVFKEVPHIVCIPLVSIKENKSKLVADILGSGQGSSRMKLPEKEKQ